MGSNRQTHGIVMHVYTADTHEMSNSKGFFLHIKVLNLILNFDIRIFFLMIDKDFFSVY